MLILREGRMMGEGKDKEWWQGHDPHNNFSNRVLMRTGDFDVDE